MVFPPVPGVFMPIDISTFAPALTRVAGVAATATELDAGTAAILARVRAWQTARVGTSLLSSELAVSTGATRALAALLADERPGSRADVVALRLVAGLSAAPSPTDDARSWALARCRLDEFARTVAV